MRKIREALRLSSQGVSTRKMACSLSIGRTTLREYLQRARKAGLSWPLPDHLSDSDLERLLFPPISRDGNKDIPVPDWSYIHSELCSFVTVWCDRSAFVCRVRIPGTCGH